MIFSMYFIFYIYTFMFEYADKENLKCNGKNNFSQNYDQYFSSRLTIKNIENVHYIVQKNTIIVTYFMNNNVAK